MGMGAHSGRSSESLSIGSLRMNEKPTCNPYESAGPSCVSSHGTRPHPTPAKHGTRPRSASESMHQMDSVYERPSSAQKTKKGPRVPNPVGSGGGTAQRPKMAVPATYSFANEGQASWSVASRRVASPTERRHAPTLGRAPSCPTQSQPRDPLPALPSAPSQLAITSQPVAPQHVRS